MSNWLAVKCITIRIAILVRDSFFRNKLNSNILNYSPSFFHNTILSSSPPIFSRSLKIFHRPNRDSNLSTRWIKFDGTIWRAERNSTSINANGKSINWHIPVIVRKRLILREIGKRYPFFREITLPRIKFPAAQRLLSWHGHFLQAFVKVLDKTSRPCVSLGWEVVSYERGNHVARKQGKNRGNIRGGYIAFSRSPRILKRDNV